MASFFRTKKNGEEYGDLLGCMYPFARFSSTNLSSSFCSAGDNG